MEKKIFKKKEFTKKETQKIMTDISIFLCNEAKKKNNGNEIMSIVSINKIVDAKSQKFILRFHIDTKLCEKMDSYGDFQIEQYIVYYSFEK